MSGAYSRNKGKRSERPEGNWAQVRNWPSYWVADDGRVWSEASHRLLRGLTSRDGYKKIHLSGQGEVAQRFVHRLVAEAFVAGSGEQVRHLNGNKQDNRAENLAWGTCKENILDKWAHGKMVIGERHHCHKIPLAEVPKIRESRESISALARRYGVSRSAIYAVRQGKAYGWL